MNEVLQPYNKTFPTHPPLLLDCENSPGGATSHNSAFMRLRLQISIGGINQPEAVMQTTRVTDSPIHGLSGLGLVNCLCVLVMTKTAKVSVSGVGLDLAGLGLGLPGLGLGVGLCGVGLGLFGLGLGLPGIDNISETLRYAVVAITSE